VITGSGDIGKGSYLKKGLLLCTTIRHLFPASAKAPVEEVDERGLKGDRGYTAAL